MTPATPWLQTLRRYLLAIAAGNLAWEWAQLPLYTIWREGTWGEIAFAALHCTGGDILIALVSLTFSLILVGSDRWPRGRYCAVGVLTVTVGTLYAIFSEWLNISVRQAWAYSDLMPVVPLIDIGLSPLAQWIIVPMLAFRWAARVSQTPTLE